MTTVRIRKQGGAAIMTIPAEILKSLRIDVGSALDVFVTGDSFTARPKTQPVRRRYSLRELLRGATPDAMQKLNDDTAWARDGKPAGREL